MSVRLKIIKNNFFSKFLPKSILQSHEKKKSQAHLLVNIALNCTGLFLIMPVNIKLMELHQITI